MNRRVVAHNHHVTPIFTTLASREPPTMSGHIVTDDSQLARVVKISGDVIAVGDSRLARVVKIGVTW